MLSTSPILRRYFGSILCLLNLIGLPILNAGFTVASPMLTTIELDTRKVLEPVNRRVMGVCLIYPPMDEAMIKLWGNSFKGISGRVWASDYYFPENRQKTDEEQWSSYLPIFREAGIAEIQAFNPNAHVNKKVSYKSATDNNLDPKHQPGHVAKQIKWLNKTPHPDFSDGYGIDAWEVWNEPQFPQNGAWGPKDMARYAIDCATAIHAVDPAIEVGVPLHEDDMQWNQQMLHHIAATDPNAISFVIFHPYDFAWIKSQHQMGTYYARVGAAEEIRHLRIREKVQLVMRMGHGRWRVACSEWNIHPPGYTKPFNVSTDIAVGIHIAGMFDVFWGEGVSAAQFFQLCARKNDGHFSMTRKTKDGLKLTPSGEVFRLYAQNFRGDRLDIKLQTSHMTYPWKDGQSFKVPLVIAHGAFDPEKKQMTLIMTNRHETAVVPTQISMGNFRPSATPELTTITADSAEGMQTLITHPKLALAAGPDPKFTLQLPPHSITAVIIPGVIPPSQDELFSDRMRFVKDWQVGQVIDPQANSAMPRLTRQLPENAFETDHSIAAGRSGYVNVSELLAVSGRLGLLREGYEAVSQTSVFSPVDRVLTGSLGMDYWGVFKVNDKTVLNITKRSGPPAPDTHRGDLPLKSGWNRLSMRLSSGSKGMGFWCALGDPGDLQYTAKPMTQLPQMFTINAQQGTYLSAWDKERTVNISHEGVLRLADKKPFHKLGYIRWNLAGLAKQLANRKVTFRVELTQAYARGVGKAWLRPVQGAWDQSTLSYEKQPTLGDKMPGEVDVHDTLWTYQSPEIDAVIQQWLAEPSTNYGMVVETNINQYCGIRNVDIPAQAPRLVVTIID